MNLKNGQTVMVNLSGAIFVGVIKEVLERYSPSGATHYKIHGKDFVTISSARSINPL